MDKYFYFRTVDDEDADDAITADSVMMPVSKLRGVVPSNTGAAGTSADEVTLYFEPVANESSITDNDFIVMDSVLLNVTVGQAKNVCKAIAEAVNGGVHTDGVIVVADDATTDFDGTTKAAVYLHSGITSCGAVTMAAMLT